MLSYLLLRTYISIYRLCKHLPEKLKSYLSIINDKEQIIVETICVFLTDVKGVYDRPPQHIDAKLLTNIHITLNGTIELPETNTLAHDVTGGILSKIKVNII